jgi:hypothetical protein
MAEGLFGDLTRNQLRILSIADRRTNTMVHVNAIMISLIVGLVLRKIEEHRNLIVPTVVLIIHRRRTLQLSYDVFIYGLAVSLVLFTVAILRF